jgi:ABC-type cobalamin/Fe3+-siderophores transport system ATPase subunit
MHRRGRGHSEVAAAFASVELDVDPHTRISDLHAADRLLLGVALAAIDQPPFLVVDDLHEDLTPDERQLVFDRLRRLTLSGTTLVVGSLDPALAPLADVVLALDGDGRPADGRPADGSPTPRLEEAAHALV